MGKKNYNIEIEELGGACCGVTGSCTLITYYNEELNERRNIILEMGLIQGEQDASRQPHRAPHHAPWRVSPRHAP